MFSREFKAWNGKETLQCYQFYEYYRNMGVTPIQAQLLFYIKSRGHDLAMEQKRQAKISTM